jgi:hypothetical protein
VGRARRVGWGGFNQHLRSMCSNSRTLSVFLSFNTDDTKKKKGEGRKEGRRELEAKNNEKTKKTIIWRKMLKNKNIFI